MKLLVFAIPAIFLAQTPPTTKPAPTTAPSAEQRLAVSHALNDITMGREEMRRLEDAVRKAQADLDASKRQLQAYLRAYQELTAKVLKEIGQPACGFDVKQNIICPEAAKQPAPAAIPTTGP